HPQDLHSFPTRRSSDLSDGRIRDVTHQAQYLSNETTVAGVDADGLVRTFDLSGEAAVMARYMGQVAVCRALVPLGRPIARYPDRSEEHTSELQSPCNLV